MPLVSDQTETAMTNLNELSINDLEAVSGGMRNRANDPGYHGPTLNKAGGVGQGDTIDTSMEVNGNLPGAGNWGN
jgi:bacteriocin-like protein